MKKIFLFCLVSFITPQLCFAYETNQGPDFVAAIFRMFCVLALVLAIIFVGIHFLKKINLARSGLFGTNRLINIVETLHLGPKNSIAAIKAGGEYILVGISGNQINYLTKLDLSSEILKKLGGENSSDNKLENHGYYHSNNTQQSVILLTEKIKEKLTLRKSNKLKKSA